MSSPKNNNKKCCYLEKNKEIAKNIAIENKVINKEVVDEKIENTLQSIFKKTGYNKSKFLSAHRDADKIQTKKYAEITFSAEVCNAPATRSQRKFCAVLSVPTRFFYCVF